jgi:tetratricopeptide (TPR) repeat protein
MKTYIFFILLFVSAIANAQISLPPNGDNQLSKVSQWIGPVEISITYHSPDVHAPDGTDRTGHIWGDLVPYGFTDQGFGTSKSSPWRAGANESTNIYFSHDVMIEGKELKAGTYGFFVVVEEKGPWTIIFSKDTHGWGSYFYDPANDALRAQASPKDANYTEWLTYGFEERLPQSTVAYLQWENKKLPFKIEVPNVNKIQLQIIKNELAGSKGFDYTNWKDAAVFCLTNKLDLNEALYFADAAISMPYIGKETFITLQVKANILLAMGKTEEAKNTMQKALNHPTASVVDLHQYARQLLNEGKKDEALEIYKLNRANHPDDKFTTYVGLARGYAAIGDKKNAIKNWEIAIKNIPEDQKSNLDYYKGELEKLKG